MAGDLIITASTIITMDPATPRATAVVVDTGAGTITAVGSAAHCRAAAPGAGEVDLGDTVLMPGFVEAHSHPFLSGVVTQAPAYWIAPYVGYPGWDDVAALFRQAAGRSSPPGAALGVQRVGPDCCSRSREPEQTPCWTHFFPGPAGRRPGQFRARGLFQQLPRSTLLGWPGRAAPPDPEGGSFGRNADGTANGRAYETAGA